MKCRRASGSVSRERPTDGSPRAGPPRPRSERQLDRRAVWMRRLSEPKIDRLIPSIHSRYHFCPARPNPHRPFRPPFSASPRDGRDFRAFARTHERGAAREVVVDEPVSRAHHVLSHHVFRDDRGARQGASRATAPRARSRNTPRLGFRVRVAVLAPCRVARVAETPEAARLARRRPRGDRTAEPEPDPPPPSRTRRTREGDARRRAATRAPPRARPRRARSTSRHTTLSADVGCASRSARRRRRRRRGSRRRRRRRGRNPSSPPTPTPCPIGPRR